MYWMALTLTLSFTIPSPPTVEQHKPYTFAVIGDTQSGRHIFLRAIKSIKKKKPDFVVHVGDLNWCSSTRWWKWYRRHIRSTKVPWHMVIGNHELLNCGPLGTPTKYKWKRFWRKKKYKRSTLKIFNYGVHKFILMDSSSTYTPRSHIKTIKRALKTSVDNSVFLFSHRPLPFRRGRMKIRFGPKKKSWHYYWVMAGMGWFRSNITLWNTVYKYKRKVKSFYHGHYHGFRKYNLDGIDAYCAGGGGGKLETKHDYFHYLLVTVRNNKHYVKVERL